MNTLLESLERSIAETRNDAALFRFKREAKEYRYNTSVKNSLYRIMKVGMETNIYFFRRKAVISNLRCHIKDTIIRMAHIIVPDIVRTFNSWGKLSLEIVRKNDDINQVRNEIQGLLKKIGACRIALPLEKPLGIRRNALLDDKDNRTKRNIAGLDKYELSDSYINRLRISDALLCLQKEICQNMKLQKGALLSEISNGPANQYPLRHGSNKQSESDLYTLQTKQCVKKIDRLHTRLFNCSIYTKGQFYDAFVGSMHSILAKGTLREDVRVLDSITKLQREIECFDTPRFFKIAVNFELAKNYIRDIIGLKKKEITKFYLLRTGI